MRRRPARRTRSRWSAGEEGDKQQAITAQHPSGPYRPKVTIKQEVGNANITIETDRPIARGRRIFGGLVPYDKLWHTGAGGSFITIDKDVTIAGQFAPASRYGLYVIPTKKEWTIILSRNSVMPDSPDYTLKRRCGYASL